MHIINGKVKPTLLSSSSVFTLVFREQANNGPRLLNTEHAEPRADTIKTWHTYSMQGSACMRHPNHLMLASASCWLTVHVTTALRTIVLHKPTSQTIVLHKPTSQSIQPIVWKGEFITAFTKTPPLVPILSHINPLASSNPIFRRSVLILSRQCLRPYASSFRTNILNPFLILNALYDS